MNIPNDLAATLLPLLDLTVKIAVLVALAALASFVLRRAAAATRHLVWLCALLASLALPAIGVLVPSKIGAHWLIPIAPTQTPPAVLEKVIESPSPEVPLAKPAAHEVTHTTTETSTAVPAVAAHAMPPTLTMLLFGLYGIGAACVLLQVIVGGAAVRRLARRAVAASPDAATAQALATARAAIGDPRVRDIQLLHLPEAVPMTWGWRKPIILLPDDAESWDTERLRVVLMHEVAHIARRDWPIQMLVHVICAAYWFHPLVWWAAARLRAESESACDDRVLLAGVAGDAYAGHLLAIAELARRRHSDGGVRFAASMARRHGIECRVRALLGSRVSRIGSVSRREILATTISGLLTASALTTLHLTIALGKLPRTIPASRSQPPPFVATLPSGVVVRLLGVEAGLLPQSHKSDSWRAKGRWWHPDGSIASKPSAHDSPFADPDSLVGSHSPDAPVSGDSAFGVPYTPFRVWVAIDYPIALADEVDVSVKTGAVVDSDAYSQSWIDNHEGHFLATSYLNAPNSVAQGAFTVEVTDTPWHDVLKVPVDSKLGTNAELKRDRERLGSSTSTEFSKVYRSDGADTFTGSDREHEWMTLYMLSNRFSKYNDTDWTVYPIDRHGSKIRVEESVSTRGTTEEPGTLESFEFRLRLRKQDVKSVAFLVLQRRGFTKVRFEHVALKPKLRKKDGGK